ncbi:MAG: DUF6261 family protein [Tannerellaceae bacterium]|jgi:hypothetical protein|nr:DUF6261 family protein [Tannerellaceae bacterium]
MKTVKNYGRIVDLFRNGEHFDFHRFIVVYANPLITGVPESQPLWNVFHNLFLREDIIYKRSSGSVETKYLKEANIARRSAFAVFRGSVNVAAIGSDGAEKEAAVILTEILKNYKAIRTAPMTETDALIVNMLQDLDKPRYAAAVQTLKLASIIEKIETENDRFMSLYEERARNLENSEEQGTMKEIRPKVDKAFKAFTLSLDITYSSGKLTGKDVTAAEDIMDYINAMVDQFERVLARRSVSVGKNGNNDGDGDDDEMSEMPVLAVAEQRIVDQKTMALVMADQVAFAVALCPKAAGGVMILVANPSLDGDHTNCPIKPYFEEDGQKKPIGLLVEPPETSFVFVSPLKSFGPCTAEVTKDGEVLAILTGVEWPMTNGM